MCVAFSWQLGYWAILRGRIGRVKMPSMCLLSTGSSFPAEFNAWFSMGTPETQHLESALTPFHFSEAV